MKTAVIFASLVLTSILGLQSGERLELKEAEHEMDILTDINREITRTVHPEYSSMKKIFL